MGERKRFHDPYYRERTSGPTRPPWGHAKPPLGCWEGQIPSWERRFCTSVCLIPWRKLCKTKEIMSLFPNIIHWDDSAGEEAFQNAKTKFWAQINNLPCDISLPDPEIYIDEIDWNPKIDPQLLSDLEKASDIDVDEEEEEEKEREKEKDLEKNPLEEKTNGNIQCPISGWDSYPISSTQPIQGSGWDDGIDLIRKHWWNSLSQSAWRNWNKTLNDQRCSNNDYYYNNNNNANWEGDKMIRSPSNANDLRVKSSVNNYHSGDIISWEEVKKARTNSRENDDCSKSKGWGRWGCDYINPESSWGATGTDSWGRRRQWCHIMNESENYIYQRNDRQYNSKKLHYRKRECWKQSGYSVFKFPKLDCDE